MNKFLAFFSLVVFGVAVSPCESRSKRQIWPAPGPDFLPDFRHRQNIRQPSNDFVDDFWIGPPRLDRRPGRRPGNQNGFVGDDFTSNGSGNNRGNGKRRTTTENLGPITTTPRTIHIAPPNCNCPMTQQFNPVCGTDGNTYRNMGLLNCYQRCGRNVSQKRLGTC